jgi:hypothetical protein
MAVLLALADHQSGRTHIVEHTTQKQLTSGTKGFEVEFEEDYWLGNSKYTFSLDDSDFLDRGYQMVQLGDNWHKDSDVTTNANIHRNNNPDIDDGAEIWTQLYESAWAKLKGGWSVTNGGKVADAWTKLTGKSATYFSFAGMTNFQISTHIAAYAKQGKWLCINTKNDFSNIVPTGNYYSGYVPGHSYYMKTYKLFDQDSRVNKIVLVNPHDGSGTVDLEIEYFQVIEGIYILETLP